MKLTKLIRNKIKKAVIYEPADNSPMKLAGKYASLKSTKKIDVDRVRNYIDYSEW